MSFAASTDWSLGPSVHGYHWAAPSPRGRVLLQHGYAEHAERFVTRYSELIPHFVDHGLDVYAFDMPGHGRSPGRRGTVDVRMAATYHLAAARSLVAAGPIVLYGHSLGGLVTARTLVENLPGVSGAVISSAALPLSGPTLRGLAALLAHVAPNGDSPGRPAPITTLARPAENAALIAADPLAYPGRLTNLTASTALQTATEVWRRAAQCTVPALILHGSDDVSTDPSGSRRLFESLGSADKTLQIVPGGCHELLNDDGREDTLAVVLDWLGAHVP